MKQSIVYHILIDRFTGDCTANNGNRYLGGTLLGILDHLDYIQTMGFNTIWISPFYSSVNYHGYHITDFLSVDPHFGTIADLQQLIHETHRRKMEIWADYVPNHCSFLHPYFVDAQQKKDSCYRHWFYFSENGDYQCFMNFKELPKLNLDHPAARKYMIDVAKYWCRLGIDGLRIDHAIGPSFWFWRKWMKEMKAEFPNKLFFGEVWCAGLSPRLMKTVHLKHRQGKMKRGISQEELQKDYIGILDGVLDFEYRNILLEFIHRREPLLNNETLYQRIQDHFSNYPKHFQLLLFLDNHDTDRIAYSCGSDLSYVQEAIQFTLQWNQPTLIYYGTEKGMQNQQTIYDGTPYADLRVRECMDWRLKNNPVILRHFY